MKRHPTTPICLAAWLATFAAVGCAPPPSYDREGEARTEATESWPSDDVTAVVAKADAPALDASAAKVGSGAIRAADGEWGTLVGKFKLVGTVPEMKQIYPTKDGHVCGAKEAMHEETLVVGKQGELANVVVYALSGPDKWETAISPVHPSFEELKKTDAILDNVNCRFEPHILAGWTEQKFRVHNADAVDHNAFAQPFANPGSNPTVSPGRNFFVDYTKPERLPFKTTCSIHTWMSSYILVRPDPYFAVSAADGTFTIENLPARELSFQFWHETLGYLKTIAVDGKNLEDRKGVHAFSVRPAANDLGEIAVNAKDYTKQIDRLK